MRWCVILYRAVKEQEPSLTKPRKVNRHAREHGEVATLAPLGKAR